MNRNRFTWLMVLCLLTLTGAAQMRDLPRMKTVARMMLATHEVLLPENTEMKELRTLSHCSVIGSGERGFVVVSNDGRRVVGVSTAPSSQGANPAFEWWLRAADEALGKEKGRVKSEEFSLSRRPDPKRFPISVAPMLKTHWGQMDPYNRKCFYDSVKHERTAVGCIATSMAQVLNYYRQPDHGVGERTAYYPYQDSISGQHITVDFSQATYRWDLLDGMANFRTQSFTDEQADAISTLMLHLGVAADMRYGTQDVNGSATTAAAAAAAFRTHFFQPEAQAVFRESYDDAEWLDMVYGELSTGHPLMYGGQAFSGGHSFVLNGYDRNGLVYINWGWNGDDEGYYDIELLNPGGTSFADRQDMVVGLFPTVILPLAADIALPAAGTMAQQLAAADLADGCTVRVSGPMGDADFGALRQVVIDHRVRVLDLSDAQFESLPERALYGCTELTTLRLPRGLKHIGDGALGDLRYLQEVNIEPAADADFTVDGDIIYNKERTELISVLSTAKGPLTVPDGVSAVHPYAFAGCVLLTAVELPASVTRLGAETFRDCYWMESLKVRSKTVVTLSGYDIFEGIDKQVCTLYVPSGLSATYRRRAQWKDFLSIEEFGTTVRANNAVRRQGEPNPVFGYEISGDAVTGVPELYTDATQDSPAGVYTIYVLPGTITAPDVEFVNGRLIVEENTEAVEAIRNEELKMSAETYDLQGRRIAGGQHRRTLLIERQADGKMHKRVTP